MSNEQPYVFGPLERRSVLLGMGWGQVGCGLGGLAGAVLVFRSVAPPGNLFAAIVVAVAAAVAGWVPVGDRTAVEWGPVIGRWVWRRATGRHRSASTAPAAGHTSTGDPAVSAPDTVTGVRILEAPLGPSTTLGVAHDRAGDSYTGVLAVSGAAFALVESSEKQRLLAGWDDILRGFGGEDSPVTRVQWVERTAPEDGSALGRDLRDRAAVSLSSASMASYLELLDDAGPLSARHEVLLAVQVTPRSAGRLMRRRGLSKDDAACAVLVDQVRLLEQRCLQADLQVIAGGLSPRMLARTLRLAVDPAARGDLARHDTATPAEAGVDPAHGWPMATEASWRTYRTDSAVHATFWVAEWPREPVGPDFLAPLLLYTGAERTVSVVMAPVPADRAVAEVEHARTSEYADERMRAEKGFTTTYRKAKERRALERRAAELQEGYADYRFSGYLTITAADDDALEDACANVTAAARKSGLHLRRMVGEQDVAFTYTLPLARGLR